MAELIEAAVRAGTPELAGRCSPASAGHDPGKRHGLGARDRGPFAGAAGRGRRGLKALPRSDRATRPNAACVPSSPVPTFFTASGSTPAPTHSDARERVADRPRAVHTTSGWRRSPSARECELEATGERARKRTLDTLDQLTPQEAQIARLAAQGQHQPRDRRSAVHQPEHGRVPPPQGVPQARGQSHARSSRTVCDRPAASD